jgi:type VI secretion system protein ImpA
MIETKMKPCINIEQLLAPIPGKHSAGDDMRYTGVYDKIKAARRSDDLLSRGEWQTDVQTADWKAVIVLCSQALTHQSKDLQIAAWLTEALLHQHGYQGLATGLQLTIKLLEKYWDILYPQIDGGDLDYRVGPMVFLNEKLPGTVCQAAICDPTHTKGYSYYAWEESCMVGLDQNLDKEQQVRRQKMVADGKVTAEAFGAAVNASSISFYKELMRQLEQCRLNLNVLDDIVNKKFSPDPPGFSKLGEAVDACFHLTDRIYKDKQKSEIIPEEDMEAHTVQTISGDTAIEEKDEPINLQMELYPNPGRHAISDISKAEKEMWQTVCTKLEKGDLKSALDRLLAAASLSPSVREKNRFLLLLAKLCLKAERPDLARPIVEQLYTLIDTLKLEQWEHPAWIAEVTETLYRCLENNDDGQTERTKKLFEKLCTLNITKAAAYRIG